MKSGIRISPARLRDLAAIENLLKETGLPGRDGPGHLNRFRVALAGDRVVGTIALEVYGSAGMLRSLAVRTSQRGRGIGEGLYKQAVKDARRTGVTTLYLLTTGAEGFFLRRGFSRIDRGRIPGPILETDHFKKFCPSDAVCMVKEIGDQRS